MNRNDWQEFLEKEEKARGYDDGFKLLFCPWKLINTADTLFLSPNPGNDPSGAFMRIASGERGNSYLVERKARHSPMAHQYRQLCAFIGKDPEEVLTGTMMPFRTHRWENRRDRPNLAITRSFWRQVLAQGNIRQVFCMGREVENEVVEMTSANLKRQVPANWGNLTIRRYETASKVQIFGLLHFSTYKMFGRPECIPQIANLLEKNLAA